MEFISAKFEKRHLEKEIFHSKTDLKIEIQSRDLERIRYALEFTIEKDKDLDKIEGAVDTLREVRKLQKEIREQFQSEADVAKEKAQSAKAKKDKEKADKAGNDTPNGVTLGAGA